MSSFNEQASIDVHPRVTEVTKYFPSSRAGYDAWSNDAAFKRILNDTFMPDGFLAAPYVSGTCGSASIWPEDKPAFPETSARNSWQNDTDIFSTSLLNQPLYSHAMTRLAQPCAPHCASVHPGVTPPTVWENSVSYPVGQHHSVRKPNGGLASKRTSAFRMQSAASPRHTPYPLVRDSTTRGPLAVICQWATGMVPCADAIAGTKKEIGQHLQAKHAIRLQPDTIKCHWGGCRKYMRRESIARHIVAVHIQDKVPCLGCGSRFARMDSLQRHQRTCRANIRGENTSEGCEVEGKLDAPQLVL